MHNWTWDPGIMYDRQVLHHWTVTAILKCVFNGPLDGRLDSLSVYFTLFLLKKEIVGKLGTSPLEDKCNFINLNLKVSRNCQTHNHKWIEKANKIKFTYSFHIGQGIFSTPNSTMDILNSKGYSLLTEPQLSAVIETVSC